MNHLNMRNQNTKTEQTLRNLPWAPRLLPILLGAVLCTAVAAAEPAAGTLRGHVNFGGGSAPQGVVVTDTVVYLTGEGLAHCAQASIPAVLNQRDIAFVPHVLPVVAGTKVELRNSDTILHTVHTASQKNPVFDRPELGNQTAEVTFDHPEVIPITCDVHSQMSAYIVVVPTPCFTKTASNGSFTLTDIPPGKYRLVAWHEKYSAAETEVEIAAGQAAAVDVNLTSSSTATKP